MLQGASDDICRIHENLKLLESHLSNLAEMTTQSGSSKPQSINKTEVSQMAEQLMAV